MTKHERKARAKALRELAGTLEDAYHDGWVTEDEFRAARTVPKLMALAAKLQLRRENTRPQGPKLFVKYGGADRDLTREEQQLIDSIMMEIHREA